MSTTVVRPIDPATPGYWMSQAWGLVNGIAVPGGRGGHPGTDYAVPMGTPVRATADGYVIYAGHADGFGDHLVSIWHPQFGVTSRYGHMGSNNVSTGDTVVAGQIIGLSNNEGDSTGPHLHFEVGLGQYIDAGNPPNIDPEQWLLLHLSGALEQLQVVTLSDADRKSIARMQHLLGVQPESGRWLDATDHAYQVLRWNHLCNAQGQLVVSLAAKEAPVRIEKKNSTVYWVQHDIFHFAGADLDGLYGPKTDGAWQLARLCWLNK